MVGKKSVSTIISKTVASFSDFETSIFKGWCKISETRKNDNCHIVNGRNEQLFTLNAKQQSLKVQSLKVRISLLT